MNYQLVNILLEVILFSFFTILQSFAINGWHEACKGNCTNDINKGKICNGNILYKIYPDFFDKNRNKTWALPIFGCIKCESSVIGGIIYWNTIIPLIGFHLFEIPLWMFNILILVTLNWKIYKNL
jgi:hypothetical protein